MAVRASADQGQHAIGWPLERRALPDLPPQNQPRLVAPPGGCEAGAVSALALTIETGWPTPDLWPNRRAHQMRVARARKTARTEGFWATRYVLPIGWKHDGKGRFKLTIEARPEVARTRDDDNLVAACKGVRDGIAQALGVDDNLFDLQPIIWGGKHNRGGRLIFTIAEAP